MATQCVPNQSPFLTPWLVPPDRERCQCEIIPAHGPFVLGPKPRAVRCPNAPDVLLVQMERDSAGERGAMAVCSTCLGEFKKQGRTGVRILRLRGRQ